MTEETKNEIQDEARELLAKCERMMTTGVVATLEGILDDYEWSWSGEFGWTLRDSEAEEELREIKGLYFNQLIAA